MLTNAQAFLLHQRPTFTVDAAISDAGLKMMADFDVAAANRMGYETNKREMREAYKGLRKAARKALKAKLRLAA